MLLDKQNLFADKQAVTAQAISTNVMDLGKAGLNIGVGEPIYLNALVTTTLDDSGDDSTLTVELVTDDNESMSSPTVIQTLGTFAANAAAGTKMSCAIPSSNLYERYIAVRFTPTGGSLSAGNVSAFLSKDQDATKAYADNRTITQ